MRSFEVRYFENKSYCFDEVAVKVTSFGRKSSIVSESSRSAFHLYESYWYKLYLKAATVCYLLTYVYK